jgi:hypothetical protein
MGCISSIESVVAMRWESAHSVPEPSVAHVQNFFQAVQECNIANEK